MVKEPTILHDIDQEDMEKVRRASQLCNELHLPAPPVPILNMQTFDRNGDPVAIYRARAQSWVRNFYNLLATQGLMCSSEPGGLTSTYGPGSLRVVRITGTLIENNDPYAIESIVGSTWAQHTTGGEGETEKGIVVGTGTGDEKFDGDTSLDPTSYQLDSQVMHGNDAGQLFHQEQENYDPSNVTYDETTETWTHAAGARKWNNNSGAGIDISEVGYYVQFHQGGSSAGYYMICRELLDTVVTVPDGGQLEAQYTFTLVVPADPYAE